MARRRKHTKKHHKRRHRMSGVGKGGAVMSSVGIIAGAVVGRYLAKSVLTSVDEKIKNAGVIAVGALLMPKILKSDLGKSLGQGMIAAGGMGLVGSFLPAIAGTGDYIDFPVSVGEVDDNLSVIAGDDSVMAGDDSSVMAGDDSLALIAGDDMDEDY